eukprot:506994_1
MATFLLFTLVLVDISQSTINLQYKIESNEYWSYSNGVSSHEDQLIWNREIQSHFDKVLSNQTSTNHLLPTQCYFKLWYDSSITCKRPLMPLKTYGLLSQLFAEKFYDYERFVKVQEFIRTNLENSTSLSNTFYYTAFCFLTTIDNNPKLLSHQMSVETHLQWIWHKVKYLNKSSVDVLLLPSILIAFIRVEHLEYVTEFVQSHHFESIMAVYGHQITTLLIWFLKSIHRHMHTSEMKLLGSILLRLWDQAFVNQSTPYAIPVQLLRSVNRFGNIEIILHVLKTLHERFEIKSAFCFEQWWQVRPIRHMILIVKAQYNTYRLSQQGIRISDDIIQSLRKIQSAQRKI